LRYSTCCCRLQRPCCAGRPLAKSGRSLRARRAQERQAIASTTPCGIQPRNGAACSPPSSPLPPTPQFTFYFERHTPNPLTKSQAILRVGEKSSSRCITPGSGLKIPNPLSLTFLFLGGVNEVTQSTDYALEAVEPKQQYHDVSSELLLISTVEIARLKAAPWGRHVDALVQF
jgi:hypothetical protein